MARPLKNCPRCNSARVSAERRRRLGGEVQEVYVACPVCKQESRLRLTTDAVEAARDRLARFRRAAERARSLGQLSSAAEEAVGLQMALLRRVAARDGMLDQVPELCPPPSQSPSPSGS